MEVNKPFQPMGKLREFYVSVGINDLLREQESNRLARPPKPFLAGLSGDRYGAFAVLAPSTDKTVAATAPGTLRRVLVVDDSRLQLKITVAMLRKMGVEVLEATSGAEALEICAQTPPDLVLSDWMMPGMDGLELCRRYRDQFKDRYGYFILLTSKSDKEDVAAGLDAGADDFLTKPPSAAELRARINAGARVVHMERALSEKNRIVSETLAELQTVYEAIDKDLQQARTIQQSLVPERSRWFDESRVSLLLHPCGHVGGDLVGFFSPGNDQLGVYCIDVSGHGITSAMVTARVAGYLSTKFLDQNLALERRFDRFHAMRPPEVAASLLNQRFAADPGVEQYLTMAFVTGDLRTGHFRLVQAGHPPPLVLRADGTVEFLGQGGLPIGLIEDATFDATDFRLFEGDRLFLYTDGFTEAVMKTGAMLEEEGFAALVQRAAAAASGPELLDDLFWRFTAEVEEAEKLDDDVSIALLEFKPGAADRQG